MLIRLSAKIVRKSKVGQSRGSAAPEVSSKCARHLTLGCRHQIGTSIPTGCTGSRRGVFMVHLTSPRRQTAGRRSWFRQRFRVGACTTLLPHCRINDYHAPRIGSSNRGRFVDGPSNFLLLMDQPGIEPCLGMVDGQEH